MTFKRLRKQICIVVAVLLALSIVVPLQAWAARVGGIEISSQGAIVIDCETGVTLYSHNADRQRVPASLTKLMSVYVIYSAAKAGEINLSAQTRIKSETSEFSYDREYSNVPLPEGSSFTLNQLLEVVVVRSACAATVALAEALSGSEEAFVSRMNQTASRMGIQARFYDSYGGSPDNRMSPRGLAVLSRALIREHPEVLAISSKKSVTFSGVAYNSSNLLLGEYEGLDGLKTGFTVPAGYCFVGTAQQNGRRIIAVTMGSTLSSRYPDTRALLDYGFSVADRVIVESSGSNVAAPSSASLVIDGAATPLTAYVINDLHYFKLRDVAYLLNSTTKQFEIEWSAADSTARLTSGEEYTPNGSELRAFAEGPRPFIPTSSNIIFNGAEVAFEVYLIDNSNYFKLRDLGGLLGFDVDWTQETRTVIISTQTGGGQPGGNPNQQPGNPGQLPGGPGEPGNLPGGANHGDLVGFFFQVVADIISTDIFLDTSIEILAFDMIELSFLSEADKSSLLGMIHDMFGFETIQAAIDELLAQGLLRTGNILFQRGLLFTFINIDSISDDEFVFSVSLWRGAHSTNLIVDYAAERASDGTWGYTSDIDIDIEFAA